MSKKRLPEGCTHIFIRTCLIDKVATIESTWDDGLGWMWLDDAAYVHNINGSGFSVSMCTTKHSELVERKAAIEIARRWLEGEYLTVDLTM